MNLEVNLEKKPSTPCIGQCKIDAFYGLCVGCGRSRAEIASWKSMSEPERLAIMAVLSQRPGRGSVLKEGDDRGD